MSNDLERKWSNFLTSLENNHCEEKNYFEAIKYVSDIDSKTIDDEEIREKINGYIETIVQFIGKHKNYYELSNVKGFKKNDGSIRGRDYYYYIADQQIKATVYYARYLNFIEGCEITAERDLDVRVRLQNICDEHGVQLDCSNKDNKVECICKSLVEHIETNDFPAMKTLEKEVLEQVDNQSGNFEDTDSQVSNLGDNGQLTLDELKSIRIELLRYGEEYKISNNIDYRLYMMLNNMMHEIRFWGAAYQYLWHWKSYKKTLYRSGLLEKKDAEKKQDKNDDIAVHKFMKDMFQECIDHMNSPSLSRHSFSENLLIDVYKYLILEKEEHNALIKIKDENGLCIVCKSIKNEKEVEFHIIKGASINSIFVDGSDQDFSTFIQNNKIPVDYGYTVEIYPQELQGETNDKGTIKGMRDTLLPLYFKSWGIDASLRRTKVADDKEVITYGKCYSDSVKLDAENKSSFIEKKDGTLFSMNLKKDDIIKLLLLLYQKKKDSDEAIKILVGKIVNGMNYNPGLKGNDYLDSCYRFEKTDETPIWKKYLAEIAEEKEMLMIHWCFKMACMEYGITIQNIDNKSRLAWIDSNNHTDVKNIVRITGKIAKKVFLDEIAFIDKVYNDYTQNIRKDGKYFKKLKEYVDISEFESWMELRFEEQKNEYAFTKIGSFLLRVHNLDLEYLKFLAEYIKMLVHEKNNGISEEVVVRNLMKKYNCLWENGYLEVNTFEGIQIFSNVTQNNQQTKDIDGIPDYLNYFNENYLCATGSGDGEFKNEIDWIDYIFFVKIYERLFIELYDSVKEWEQWELKQKKSFSFLEKSLAKEKLNGNLNLYLRYREICKTECSVHGRLCQENNISKEVLSSLSEEQWKVCISKKVIENQHTELEVFIDFDDNQQAKEAIIKYMSENHDSKLTKDFVAKVIEEYYFNKNKDEIFFWKWDDTNKNYCEIQKEEAITVGKFHIQVSKLVKFKEMFKRNTSEHLLKYIWTTYEGEDKDNWLSDNLNKFDYSRAMGILEFDCEDFKKKWMELYGDNSI